MPTKPELEADIARLKKVVHAQEKAVSQLSEDAGCEVSFPHAPYGMDSGPFIYDGAEKVVESKILKVLWDVCHEHGIPRGHGECPGAFARAELLPVRDYSNSGGRSFIIPSLAAKMIAGLLNGVADYGAACYRGGYSDGVSHLKQLADGKMSAGDFEESDARSKASAVQKHKRYLVRKR